MGAAACLGAPGRGELDVGRAPLKLAAAWRSARMVHSRGLEGPRGGVSGSPDVVRVLRRRSGGFNAAAWLCLAFR